MVDAYHRGTLQIVNLTSHDKNSLSRRELFCSLALVALAQSLPDDDLDISIERLSASIPNLPLPRLSVPPASSTLRTGYNLSSPGPDPGSASPWDTTGNQNGNSHHRDQSAISSGSGAYNGDRANPEAEAERGYWKRLETVEVTLIAEKEGWFLQKYRVESDVSDFRSTRIELSVRNAREKSYRGDTRILSGCWTASASAM